MQVRHVSCCLALSCALLAGQTSPAQAGAESMAASIFEQLNRAEATNKAILEQLSKSPPATQEAVKLAASAAEQAHRIRQGVEDLDQHYTTMSPERQDALRRAWSVAVIMDACSSPALDGASSDSARLSSELRTSAECALRRAGQLQETLAPFKPGAGRGNTPAPNPEGAPAGRQRRSGPNPPAGGLAMPPVQPQAKGN
jgi:hypothetical protein